MLVVGGQAGAAPVSTSCPARRGSRSTAGSSRGGARRGARALMASSRKRPPAPTSTSRCCRRSPPPGRTGPPRGPGAGALCRGRRRPRTPAVPGRARHPLVLAARDPGLRLRRRRPGGRPRPARVHRRSGDAPLRRRVRALRGEIGADDRYTIGHAGCSRTSESRSRSRTCCSRPTARSSASPTARMMQKFLNLAGFTWPGIRAGPCRRPFTYRVTTLPGFDLHPQPGRQARADVPCRARPRRHRRRTRHGRRVEPAPVPVPRHARRDGAQRHLREFARMRYDLVEHVRPDLAENIAGRTDSEWIYALVMSQLDDPYGEPEAGELANAVAAAAPAARGPGPARDRHLVAREPVPRHRQVAGRDAVLVRLWLVSRRRRPARDRPAVLQPLVHRRRRLRAG